MKSSIDGAAIGLQWRISTKDKLYKTELGFASLRSCRVDLRATEMAERSRAGKIFHLKKNLVCFGPLRHALLSKQRLCRDTSLRVRTHFALDDLLRVIFAGSR